MAGGFSKIPSTLHLEMLEKGNLGWTTHQIAEWLRTTHAVATTYKSVWRVLDRLRKERATIAKVVLSEKLSTSLTTDIDRLERYAAKASLLADSHEDDPKAWVPLVDQLRKLTEVKLRFSGAGADDEPRRFSGIRVYLPPED